MLSPAGVCVCVRACMCVCLKLNSESSTFNNFLSFFFFLLLSYLAERFILFCKNVKISTCVLQRNLRITVIHKHLYRGVRQQSGICSQLVSAIRAMHFWMGLTFLSFGQIYELCLTNYEYTVVVAIAVAP